MESVNIDQLLFQGGQILTRQLDYTKPINSLLDVEFKVFSQWEDDGIIQYLINYLDIPTKKFIEFGVENYMESNTRFLLMNNNWSGLVLDGNPKNIDFIKSQDLYWKYDLIARAVFVNKKNINEIIRQENFQGKIGLLHIDIDGNDYWIWKAINVVSPVLVIVEYNSVFGSERAITIPYKPGFERTKEHYSNLYAGASLAALYHLANEKGYVFIGCNSAGNNAYFVKREFKKNLKELTVEEGFIKSKFRESRDKNGNLTYLRGEERLNKIKGMPIYNIRENKIESL
tara:strand:+ start:1429 stop:2286 length:858 start_codon:yes stop_codon:yes gene_type:complete